MTEAQNCGNCGVTLSEEASFCKSCGASLSEFTESGAGIGTAELPMVDFAQAISRGFRNYFNFSGRATRAEYWWWGLFIVLVSIVLQVVDTLFGEVGQWVSLLVQLAVLLPSLALGARRLHDINRAGWWQLLWFVLLIGGIVLIVWAIKRGDKGPNKYGPGPRQATSTI